MGSKDEFMRTRPGYTSRLKYIINVSLPLVGLLLLGSQAAAQQGASLQESVAKSLADASASSEQVQGIEAAIGEDEGSYCATGPDRSACRTRFRKAIAFKQVLLSPSGQHGVIVGFSLRGFCGSRGCSIYILKQDGETYKNILGTETGVLTSFVFSKTVTHGFYDVTVNNGTLSTPDHTKYIWNGSKYILTPEEAIEFAKISREFKEQRERAHERQVAEQREAAAQASDSDCYMRETGFYRGCVTIKVIKSDMVRITSTDGNGYTHNVSGPLQRMLVSVENVVDYAHVNGYRAGMVMDILAYGTHTDTRDEMQCPFLAIGSVHRLMAISVPGDHRYLLTAPEDKNHSEWQVLEVCTNGNCTQISTVNDRRYPYW